MKRLWIAPIAALAAFGGLAYTTGAAPAASLAAGAQVVKNIAAPESRVEKTYYYYHRRYYRHRGYYRHHYYRHHYWHRHHRRYYYGGYYRPYYYPYYYGPYYWHRYYW